MRYGSHSMVHTYTLSIERFWIGPSPRPLPDNTQHSLETYIHAPAGFESTISASERPETHALECAATGIGIKYTTPEIAYGYKNKFHLIRLK